MEKAKLHLRWTRIDPETLSPEARGAYDAVRHLQAEVRAAQSNLERIIAKSLELPDTHQMRLSYKYGNLNVAIEVAKAKTLTSRAVDLETFKAAVRRAGP